MERRDSFMILIINICKENLHYYEFVKPIEDIVGKEFFTKKFLDVSKEDLEIAEKVIICGTSLMDFNYFNYLSNFSWIKEFNKPILGICGGMQILVSIFGGEVCRNDVGEDFFEVGFIKLNFKESFLGLKGEKEVYNLHKFGVENIGEKFKVYTKSKKGIQAIKHKEKKIYGVLFHPEVRQKEVIKEFLKNG